MSLKHMRVGVRQVDRVALSLLMPGCFIADDSQSQVYEKIFQIVSESPGRSLLLIDRLVKVCEGGAKLRPQSSLVHIRLAQAKFLRVDKDLEYEKPSKKDMKKAALVEVRGVDHSIPLCTLSNKRLVWGVDHATALSWFKRAA